MRSGFEIGLHFVLLRMLLTWHHSILIA